MSVASLNRKLHRWGALLVVLPFAVMLGSGVFLQLKKHWSWVQPSTERGSGQLLALSFDEILEATRAVPEAGVSDWEDVERLDVRPERGMLKVRCKSGWEVQLDTATAQVLSVAYRRSDLIESIHDGSWFHPLAKLWVFLPTAFILIGLYCTGVYLWLLPHRVRRRRNVNKGPGA